MSPIPRRGRFAIAQQRHEVVRVVDHLQIRDRVLDLGALVEAWAADHLVADALPDEHVFEHAALRVRAVDDGDLAAAVALLDAARDLGRDEPRLAVLVLGLDDVHELALAEVRPQVLLLALAVVRDHLVRRGEDRVRRAVVLLERDHLRVREVVLELEDVADVGGPERVDRLVRIADHHQVLVILREQLQQHVLRVVRVLVLVDEHVAERLRPLLARLGEPLQHVDGEHQHVVEVDGVRREQPALVELVHVGDRLVVEARDA